MKKNHNENHYCFFGYEKLLFKSKVEIQNFEGTIQITILTQDSNQDQIKNRVTQCCDLSHVKFVIQIKSGRAKFLLSKKVVIQIKSHNIEFQLL